MAPAAPDGGAESQRQADLLKQEGNAFFRKERLSAAIDAYTGAITLCPNVAVYWTNRALCYRKRNEWAKVEEDCRTAIQLDIQSVKGVPASVLIVSCNKDTQNQVVARRSFFRCSTVQLHWNKGSTGLLVLAQADVDKTNCQLLHYVNLSTVWDVAELG